MMLGGGMGGPRWGQAQVRDKLDRRARDRRKLPRGLPERRARAPVARKAPDPVVPRDSVRAAAAVATWLTCSSVCR
jgi:hypothetical protein